ncbi:cation transporter [Candidatus Bathyarchaeota archaeon]|nr:cation transporter [Candidatus Bathyarchaeota archaeon]
MSNQKVASVAVIGGLVIFITKILAYLFSGSIALLSDALESISNILASLLMFLSLRISSKPADVDHQYGHQKIEYVSASIEGILVSVAGLAIAYTAINRIFTPVELGIIDFALIISFSATIGNALLSMYLSKNAKISGSLALEGDSKHLLSDVLSSIGVLVGLIIAKFTGWTILDPLLALFISGLVLKMGIELIVKSINGLLDQSCPEVESKISDLLNQHKPNFVDYHNLRTRRSGNKIYAELHLSINGETSVKEAHDFTDHLQKDLVKEIPTLVINIHIEPPNANIHD